MKRIAFWFGVVITILFCLNCSDKSNPTELEKIGTIEGEITESVSGVAIDSATITTDPATSSVVTNSSGEYEIAGVNPGFYTISVSKSGYYTKTKKVSVTKGTSTTLNISISPLTVTDIDGNTYKTVKIGDQIWMAENLKVMHYRNGVPIRHGKTKDWAFLINTGAYCEYDDDMNNVTIYGLLYNWHALKDSNNIAPEGWHVPTDVEWQILIDYLGGKSAAGGMMKEAGTVHWNAPNAGATNESGFCALPGGFRHIDSIGDVSYQGIYESASFWSATETIFINNAWNRELSSSSSGIFRNSAYRRYGFSVRCVMD